MFTCTLELRLPAPWLSTVRTSGMCGHVILGKPTDVLAKCATSNTRSFRTLVNIIPHGVTSRKTLYTLNFIFNAALYWGYKETFMTIWTTIRVQGDRMVIIRGRIKEDSMRIHKFSRTCRRHLKIPGAIKITCSRFHSECPHTLVASAKYLVAQAIWRLLFVNPWTQ